MMNGDYRLLRASSSDTLGSLSSAQSVSVGDLWLPLAALLPRRAKDDTPVPIPPHTPIVLLDSSTGHLVTRRQDILTLIPILFVNEANLAIPPNAVPPNCTVFVRATKHMSKKQVSKDTEVLHRPITAAQTVAEGSALREEPRGPAPIGPSQKATTLSTVAGCADTEHRPKRARSDAVFDTYLSEALKGRGAERCGAMIAETMANITRVRGAPPLHFVTHGKAHTSLSVGGLSWNMMDERVLCRVFRRGREADGGKCTYSDAARLIAVFLIDGVLMKRAAVSTEVGQAVWTLADADLPATARALRERGYRVVLLDHYPSLHHGNAVALDAKLLPITELCQKYLDCDVTVVVSTMSYISAAHRRDGMSFVFPYSGLWQFFIAQLNGGIRVDDHSLLVGAAPLSNDGEPSDISSQHHRDVQLAANCGLRFLDAEQIKKETIAA